MTKRSEFRDTPSSPARILGSMNLLSTLLPWAFVIAFASDFCAVSAFSIINNGNSNNNAPMPVTSSSTKQQSRSEFLTDALTKGGSAAALVLSPRPGFAADADADIQPKLAGISDDELKRIITRDVVDKQFLVSADITREVYDESADFIDEIDTYPMQKWIVGTKRLFVAEKSRVNLVGDVDVSKDRVEFRFDEDLMFRIPLLYPVVSLTGRVVLDRDPTTGLITKYQECWDQSVNDVLKTAKFNSSR